MREATGYVAAGGRSSRMGQDKALLEIEGRPIIARVIDALTAVCSSVAILANGAGYERFGLPVFRDSNIDVGPLEAIRTALTNSQTPFAIVAACDLPFVTSELFAFLLRVPGDWQAIVPLDENGMIEPLCAVYSTEAQREVTCLIEAGERKVSALHEGIRTLRVSFDEIRHLNRSESFFENVNTPEDYSEALARLSGARPALGDRR